MQPESTDRREFFKRYAVDVTAHGATGNGTTNDLPAILTAAIVAGPNGVLFFPPGRYVLNRTGVLSYSWLLAQSNLTICGVRGQSWLMHPAGMPNSSVAILQIDNLSNITIRDMGFDGNWGNRLTTITSGSDRFVQTGAAPYTLNVLSTEGFPASGTCTVIGSAGPEVVTYTAITSTSFLNCTGGTGTVFTTNRVGYVNAATGINHTTQADPKNYMLMIRGADNVLVEDCLFRQAYGDFVWIGGSATDPNKRPATNIRVFRCSGDMSARNGFTLGGYVDGVTIQDCVMTSIDAQAMDSEPVNSPVRNVKIIDNDFDSWWDLRGDLERPDVDRRGQQQHERASDSDRAQLDRARQHDQRRGTHREGE